MFIAGILYLCILFSFLQNALLFAVVATVLFSFRYGAASLIPLALVIDGHFGNFHTLPLLSMVSIVWYMLVEYLRPIIMRPALLHL